eukprot:Pgem_evm1s15259
MGVEIVSVYAFSIENFKRSEEEVSGLMNLAKDKLLELCSHRGFLEKNQIRIKIVGDLDLLPPDLQKVMIDSMKSTEKHS